MKISLFLAATSLGLVSAAPLGLNETNTTHLNSFVTRASTNSVKLYEAPCIFGASSASKLKSSNYRDMCKTLAQWKDGWYISKADGTIAEGSIKNLGKNTLASAVNGVSDLSVPLNSQESCDHIVEAEQLQVYVQSLASTNNNLATYCVTKAPDSKDKDAAKKTAVAQASLDIFMLLNGASNMQTVSLAVNIDKNTLLGGSTVQSNNRRAVAAKSYLNEVKTKYTTSATNINTKFTTLLNALSITPPMTFQAFTSAAFTKATK
ncbi:hypothetical protein GQ54DRAFT_296262 [Martensiomyces pterosporus]|nr:hypothetical protein GQ54DRAFT_296262 [Martensiomyces pterosporus]